MANYYTDCAKFDMRHFIRQQVCILLRVVCVCAQKIGSV